MEEGEVAGARAKGKEPIVDARVDEKEPAVAFALTKGGMGKEDAVVVRIGILMGTFVM
jgi:hypothetical protein